MAVKESKPFLGFNYIIGFIYYENYDPSRVRDFWLKSGKNGTRERKPTAVMMMITIWFKISLVYETEGN